MSSRSRSDMVAASLLSNRAAGSRTGPEQAQAGVDHHLVAAADLDAAADVDAELERHEAEATGHVAGVAALIPDAAGAQRVAALHAGRADEVLAAAAEPARRA